MLRPIVGCLCGTVLALLVSVVFRAPAWGAFIIGFICGGAGTAIGLLTAKEY